MLLDSGSDLSWLRSAEFEKLGGKVEWAGRLKIVYANGDEERIPTERKTICVTITHPELSKVIMRVQVYKQRAIKGQDYVLTIGRACMGANNVLYAWWTRGSHVRNVPAPRSCTAPQRVDLVGRQRLALRNVATLR